MTQTTLYIEQQNWKFDPKPIQWEKKREAKGQANNNSNIANNDDNVHNDHHHHFYFPIGHGSWDVSKIMSYNRIYNDGAVHS